MWEIIVAAIMGVVEGLTEFVPVSSTGHLIIVGNLLKFTDETAKCFEVVIQLGAILSVVFLYWGRFKGLFNFRQAGGFYGIRGWWLLFLTSLPAAVAGVVIYKPMKTYLFHPIPVVIALAVGAIGILMAEKYKPAPKVKSLDELNWRHALSVGLFQ
jgi:undecaprenyl-diphosphatase